MAETRPVDARGTVAAQGDGARRQARKTRKPDRLALELVALRGKDVIGVRHLLDGGKVWLGDALQSLARVPLQAIGGRPLVVGDVEAGTYRVHVPPRARARVHQRAGLARILMGPETVVLSEGERAVLHIGSVQVRAQVVPLEGFARGLAARPGPLGWIALAGALYLAALAICAALTPAPTAPVASAGVERAASSAAADAARSAALAE